MIRLPDVSLLKKSILYRKRRSNNRTKGDPKTATLPDVICSGAPQAVAHPPQPREHAEKGQNQDNNLFMGYGKSSRWGQLQYV